MIFQIFGKNHNKVKEVDIGQIKIKVTADFAFLLKLFRAQKFAHLSEIKKYHFAKNNCDHSRNINLLKHSDRDSTSIDLLIVNDFYYSFTNESIVKVQTDEPIPIETRLGGFISSGVFIDENIGKECSISFNSTHVLCITAEDNIINDYEEENRVYQDELKVS